MIPTAEEHYARRVGQAPSFWTDANVAALRELAAGPEKFSASQIAAKLGCSKNAVIGKLGRLGMALPKAYERETVTHIRKPRKPRQKRSVWSKQSAPRAEVAPKPAKSVHEPAPPPIKPLYPVHRACKYPHGDPATVDFYFCGATPREKSPYCPAHHALCYVPRHPERRSVVQAYQEEGVK